MIPIVLIRSEKKTMANFSFPAPQSTPLARIPALECLFPSKSMEHVCNNGGNVHISAIPVVS